MQRVESEWRRTHRGTGPNFSHKHIRISLVIGKAGASRGPPDPMARRAGALQIGCRASRSRTTARVRRRRFPYQIIRSSAPADTSPRRSPARSRPPARSAGDQRAGILPPFQRRHEHVGRIGIDPSPGFGLGASPHPPCSTSCRPRGAQRKASGGVTRSRSSAPSGSTA